MRSRRLCAHRRDAGAAGRSAARRRLLSRIPAGAGASRGHGRRGGVPRLARLGLLPRRRAGGRRRVARGECSLAHSREAVQRYLPWDLVYFREAEQAQCKPASFSAGFAEPSRVAPIAARAALHQRVCIVCSVTSDSQTEIISRAGGCPQWMPAGLVFLAVSMMNFIASITGAVGSAIGWWPARAV